MQKNTFSLLSSNWMFIANTQTALFPYLFNMINGKDNSIENSLSKTTHFFQTVEGLKSAFNASSNTDTQEVAIINIHHPIFKYDQVCGPKGTQSIINLLESWKNDASIVGVVFDVNSGGGQASGNSEFAEYLYNYPKPTVTFTKDMIGSAAYYFSAGTDHIIASKHADMIGCIGTMMYNVDLEGVLLKKGATIHELYADLSTEKNAQKRALKNGDSKPIINKFLNPSAKQFHTDVKKYRPAITEKALKGDVFNPEEALKEGLIDEIGTMQTAIDKIFELAKKDNNTQKTQKMSNKKQYKKLEAIAGVQFENSTEEGVFLNATYADAVEQKIKTLETAVETANTETATATQTINELQTAATAEQTAYSSLVTAVNEKLNLEGDAKVTTVANAIEALTNKIDALGEQPGQTHKTPLPTTKKEGDHSYMDLDTPFYNHVKQYLN